MHNLLNRKKLLFLYYSLAALLLYVTIFMFSTSEGYRGFIPVLAITSSFLGSALSRHFKLIRYISKLTEPISEIDTCKIKCHSNKNLFYFVIICLVLMFFFSIYGSFDSLKKFISEFPRSIFDHPYLILIGIWSMFNHVSSALIKPCINKVFDNCIFLNSYLLTWSKLQGFYFDGASISLVHVPTDCTGSGKIVSLALPREDINSFIRILRKHNVKDFNNSKESAIAH